MTDPASSSAGMAPVLDESTKLGDRNYTTSVALENDEICGIEVAPCSSDEAGTLSTEPLLSDSIETISTHPSDEIMPQESIEVSPTGITVCKHDQAFASSSCMDSSLISSRVDELFDVLDHEIGGTTNTDPILQFQVEYIDHHSEDVPTGNETQKSKTTSCNTNGTLTKHVKHVDFRLDNDFFNLLDPSPKNNIFADILTRSHNTLCQVVLGALDVPFLFNQSKSAAPRATEEPGIQAPFMMFPEQSQALVSQEDNDNYIVSSSGPLNKAILTQLFGLQDNLGGRNVRVKSIAYRDGLPSMTGKEPVHLDSNMLQLRLSEWKRGRSGRKKAEPEKESSEDGENKKFCVPNTSLIPLVAGQDKCDATADLFADEELKAVLKITKDGEEVSPLFPSFSADDMSSVAFSDDGLDDELGALDDINDELRKELAFADVVINGSDSGDSSHGKKRRNEEKKKSTATEPPLQNPIATDTTLSSTDSECSISVTSPDTAKATTGLGRQHPTRSSKKRVKFARCHEEFLYHADQPIIMEDEKNGKNDAADPWFSNLEDAYMVLEDMIDDLALSCTNYVSRSRKQPSLKTKIRASTAHFV